MKRQAWLDYIKFIAMFLVVVYHTPPRCEHDGHVHELALFNLGAPVFFFAAGYLFNMARQRGFFAFLKKRARQILVPYTTFFIIFYALWLVIGRRMAGADEQAIDTLTPLWQFIQGTPKTVLGPFWFLACLFTMQLIYYPIKKCLSGFWPVVVAILLNLSLFIIPAVPWVMYWNLDRALLFMPIYAVGNCGREWFDKVSFDKPANALLWLILGAVGVGFLVIAPLTLDREVSYILATEAILCVLPLIVAICKWLESRFGTSRVAQTVAITSITYLALQNYLIGIIKMLVAKVLGPELLDGSILMKVAIAIAVMVILYPLALLIDRYLPFLLGKSYKKGRTVE